MKVKDCIGIKAVVVIFVLLSFIFSSLSAVPVGKFSYRLTPEDIDGDTIVVNDTMVAMSEKIRVFQETILDELDTIPDTPAVFFLIDNSSSMSLVERGIDTLGNRFTATSAFIDAVMAKYPQAEVGLAVFSGGLYYSPTSKPNVFQTVTTPAMGLDDTGAFVPLLTLGQMYGTQTGYEILKEVLDVDTSSSSVLLSYPSIRMSQQGTNINSGFDAALQAFAVSKIAKNKQCIIFISDGEANAPTGSSNTFTTATNCPTTFTVYFTQRNTIPTTIQTYTTNCRANGYSSANINSNAWLYYNTTSTALMEFLMHHIFPLIDTTHRVYPASITINGQANTSLWSSADSVFSFSSLFPLQSLITPFSYVITKGNADTAITKSINFWVKTQQGAPFSRTTYTVRKWDRNLIFSDSAETAITAGTEAMDEIGLYFSFTRIDTLYTYTNVSIDLCNALTPVDKETIILSKEINTFSGKFKRAVSDQPTPGNNILETHAENDSIIAIFRNSETPPLPLDTLRIAIPYQLESAIRFSDRKKKLPHTRQLVIGSYRLGLNRPKEPFTLWISDIKGSMVKRIAVRNPGAPLPSNLLPQKSGLYIITVVTEQNHESVKVLFTR